MLYLCATTVALVAAYETVCNLFQPTDVNEFKLRYGIDYAEADLEWDEDEIGSLSRKPANCNESLTKKKFCQSTKLFFSIFRSDEDFSELVAVVRRTRKQTHNILFSLFLDAFRQNVREK